MRLQLNDNDPRVIRTRKLIQDAFYSLAKEKRIEDITINDLTKRATVNRATFYAHFDDKYALLENMVSNAFMTFVSNRLQLNAELTEDTVRALIISICHYTEAINNQCKRSYESFASMVHTREKIQLQSIVMTMLANSPTFAGIEQKKLELVATMVSWSICGAAEHWYKTDHLKDAALFTEEVLPLVMSAVKAAI